MPPPANNGYGAVNSTSTTGNGAGARSNDEEQPLLGHNSGPKSSLRTKLHAKVKRDRADVVLLLCYIITGLLDSASISTWGSFVSMQTGNTVYIGLGLAAPKESNRWIKSGTSLISFCIGSFFFSRFHRYFYPSKRWVLCASFLFQALLIAIAAAILTFGPKESSAPNSSSASNEIPWNVLVPIALVAFQSCGQAVTSRALKFNALTSVVLTSIYCDLFSDANLFAANNVERNRRVGAPLMLLLGAVIGGMLAHSEIGTPGVLWLASGLKLLIMITWLLWKAEEE